MGKSMRVKLKMAEGTAKECTGIAMEINLRVSGKMITNRLENTFLAQATSLRASLKRGKWPLAH